MNDKHGISVILAAIWEGHTDCVKTLLKHVSGLYTNENPGKSFFIHTAHCSTKCATGHGQLPHFFFHS